MSQPEIPLILQAIIRGPDVATQQKNVIFDASLSVNPFADEALKYFWDFGDGVTAQGEEVVHLYKNAGTYAVHLRVRDKEGNEQVSTKEIFVYREFLLLVTDDGAQEERVKNLVAFAKERGIFIQVIAHFEPVSDFVVEEILIKKMSEALDDFTKADRIVFWTRSSLGLTLLSQFKPSFLEAGIDLTSHDIVFVSDGFLPLLVNIALGPYRALRPHSIILTRSEGLWTFVDSPTLDIFLSNLAQRAIPYRIVAEHISRVTFWNFPSHILNFMIHRGIPSNSLQLLLMIPVIVTFVAFMKQIVGVTTFGVYTPSIVTLSFIALDISYGLIILIILLVIGTLIRLFLRRYRLLYIPRIAILLTFASITIVGILFLGALFDISDLVSISIFPMLIMSTLVEKFVSIQTGTGFKSALVLISETIVVSILCYYLVEWDFLKILMLSHPELILVFLVINVILGRWTGLRIFEYVRFREVIRHAEE
ncbi:PKD domain-containing protein [Candidatus Peregrinibacteria bacterium]|nr:PKD domain-containing protein [Candidatus Peregrinibacteria bacterium]